MYPKRMLPIKNTASEKTALGWNNCLDAMTAEIYERTEVEVLVEILKKSDIVIASEGIGGIEMEVHKLAEAIQESVRQGLGDKL